MEKGVLKVFNEVEVGIGNRGVLRLIKVGLHSDTGLGGGYRDVVMKGTGRILNDGSCSFHAYSHQRKRNSEHIPGGIGTIINKYD